MKSILLFGAGKIGRSFLAQLFSQSGYQVIFVDINQQLVDLLNKTSSYRIVIKEKTENIITITNYKAIHVSNKDEILEAFTEASLMATSVGINAIPSVSSVIAEGLLFRYEKRPDAPVDIIIAENIREADRLFEKNLRSLLPEDYPFKKLVGLVETSIGKMVPIMTKEDLQTDPLQIFAEGYNTLPISAKGFKNNLPDVEGLKFITNIKAWVDRKALIHNLGHASAAYFGNTELPQEPLLWKVLANKKVYGNTYDTMMQAANILLHKYPDKFTVSELERHIDDLLQRFQNKALGDSVYRVGCDLFRKLSEEDRLSGAIKLAKVLKQPYDKILHALVAGFHFGATDEKGAHFPRDAQFTKELQSLGFEQHFANVTGFNKVNYPDILAQAIVTNEQLKAEKK